VGKVGKRGEEGGKEGGKEGRREGGGDGEIDHRRERYQLAFRG